MNKTLHCLIVDDSEDDALLEVAELQRGGYEVTWSASRPPRRCDARWTPAVGCRPLRFQDAALQRPGCAGTAQSERLGPAVRHCFGTIARRSQSR